jgi:cytochrome c oxidase subunit IV
MSEAASQPTAAEGAAPARPRHHPNYIGVWVGLAVLTGIELSVAFLPWPKRVIVLCLVGLALWKALLVALYYMHLRFEPNRVRLMAIAPLPLAVILVVSVLMEHL